MSKKKSQTRKIYRKKGGVNLTKTISNLYDRLQKKNIVHIDHDDLESLNQNLNLKGNIKKVSNKYQMKKYGPNKHYIGELKNGLPHGKGTMYEDNTTVIPFGWKNGNPYGNGKIMHSNGDIEYVTWNKMGQKMKSRMDSPSPSPNKKNNELRTANV